jgi:hypothetical protein
MLVELSTARATGRAGSLLSQRVRAFCGARGFTGVGPVFKRAHVRVLLHVPLCYVCVLQNPRLTMFCSIGIHRLLCAQKPAS